MPTVTAETLQARLASDYEYTTEAEALFFKDVNGSASFRFETDDHWEFSRGFYIGPDPKGILYYGLKDSGVDVFGGTLPIKQKTEAYFYVDQVLNQKGDELTHIKFFTPGPKPDLATATPIAEFLAKDKHSVTGPSGLLRKLTTGTWKKTNYASPSAIVYKAKDSREIILTCDFLHQEAVILCDKNDKIYGEAINNTTGKLTVRSLKAVSQGNWVRWRHDNVVFHPGRDATEFSAFFFPSEGSSNGPHPLGSSLDEKKWTNVEWKSIPENDSE